MKLKEFIKRHKLLLIILIAILVAATNYLVYPTLISKQLSLVDVPVAQTQLNENALISKEDITTISIDKAFLPKNIVLDKDEIIGKYIKENCTISANGFFYSDQLTDSASTFGGTYSDLKDGEYAYTVVLDEKHFGTSMIYKKGQHINVYYYEEYLNEDGNKAYMFGELAENIRIVGVVESNSSQTHLVLAVNEEQVSLFTLSELYGNLIPLVTYQSDGIDVLPTTVYNIDNTKTYIKNKSTLISSIEEIDEVKNQNTIETQEQQTVEGAGE